MIVRTQDETAIYDIEKMMCVYAVQSQDKKDEFIVYGLSYTGELAYPFGRYKTMERAKSIVEEIYALCTSQSRYDMPII